MGLFYGVVGFVETKEDPVGSGIWVDVPVERKYRGEIRRNTKRWERGEGLNSNLSISNTISIVADPYSNNHLNSIRYVRWLGGYWEVTDVDVDFPRLTLSIGGVYNGPTTGTPNNTGEHPRIT